MKIIRIEEAKCFYVEMEDGSIFRRSEYGTWEENYPNSWESCFSKEIELEDLFQEAKCKNL